MKNLLVSGPVAGDTSTQGYTFHWDASWNAENCEVVAFITQGENGRVVNVAKQTLGL